MAPLALVHGNPETTAVWDRLAAMSLGATPPVGTAPTATPTEGPVAVICEKSVGVHGSTNWPRAPTRRDGSRDMGLRSMPASIDGRR
jgi:hypothetical protein